MPFRKLVGSYKSYDLPTHVIEAGYLAVDVNTGDLRIGDGSTAGGTLLASGNISQVGAVTFFGTKLTSPSNGDIEIEPGGTGNLLVQGLQFHDNAISARNSNDSLQLDGAGTGTVVINGLSFPTSDGTSGQVLVTDGSGTLSFSDQSGGGSSLGDLTAVGSTLSSPSNADLTLTPGGTGGIVVDGVRIKGTSLSADDSSTININEGVIVSGAATISGALSSATSLSLASGATVTGIADEDNMASDSNTLLATQQSVKAYVDAQDANIASDTLTFTNKTFDVEATGNSISNIDVADLKSGVLDTDISSVSGSDDTLASAKAIKTYVDNEVANVSVGDLSFVGSTIAAPSNADLTLTSANGNVVIEGIRFSGTTIQTEDSSPGIEINGNLIPSQNNVFQLGSASRRWQKLFVASTTIDLGGATISSDGTGSLSIAANGATLPSGSKVGDRALVLGGKTNATTQRPAQLVKIFVSDGSSNFTDEQLLQKTADLELEFNGTVEDVPVYTEAEQSFTLSDGTSLSTNAAGITLFQF